MEGETSLQFLLLDHSSGAVKVEDIKKEGDTEDKEVDNIDNMHGAPQVTVKVETRLAGARPG